MFYSGIYYMRGVIMKKVISAIASIMMALILFVPLGGSVTPVMSVTAEAATISKPVASVKSGTYTANTTVGMQIKLTCAEKGAEIYYSLNGAKYEKYLVNISIKGNSTLKVYSKTGAGKSSVVTYNYYLKPELTFKEKNTSTGKTISITPSSKNNIKLYYTTDGTKPTTKSKEYSAWGIKITKSSRVRVLAVKSGWTNAYYDKKYTVSSSDTSTSSGTNTSSAKGQSYFKTPGSGKGDVLFNGSRITSNVAYSVYTYGEKTKEQISVWLDKTTKRVVFLIDQNQSFESGDTLTLSDFSKGNGNEVIIYGLGLREYGVLSSDVYHSQFDKVEFKAISVDYTGKNDSSFYFYIKAHDEKGKSQTIEGIAKVKLTGSKHNSSAGNASGNKDSGSAAKKDYTSLDGRFSVNVNEAEVLLDGKRYSATAGRESKGHYDLFSINDINGDNDLYIVQISQCVNVGKTTTLKDYRIYKKHFDSDVKHKCETGVIKGGSSYSDYNIISEGWLRLSGFGYGTGTSTLHDVCLMDDIAVTWEYDSNGVAAGSFYIEYVCKKETHTLEGYFAVPYKGIVVDINACPHCMGSKKCGVCGGYGKCWYGLKQVLCYKCRGSGKCTYCKGSGYQN